MTTSKHTIKTVLHTFSLLTTRPEDCAKYEQLCEKLDDGRHQMRCWPIDRNYSVEAGPVELETEFLFSNQWNTADGKRVFDWYEGIVDNPNYRIGHYLEITDEMREIRRNTNVCGFCGHQEAAQKGNVFCCKCLGSPYLKETELYLLRMLPVELHFPNRKPLSKAESEYLTPLYVEAQTKTNQKAMEIRYKTIETDRARKINNANDEADGFIWLMDRDIPTDNVIYYPSTGKFAFGWRSTMSESVEKALVKKLENFPYEYEFTKPKY